MNHEESRNQKGRLARLFPAIRGRDEILRQIAASPDLAGQFERWDEEAREDFLSFCSGARGLKVVYDGIFKEIFNPETAPERLEALLSLLLKREIHIDRVLPNDSVRLGAESSLLYTDIVVQQKDGSLSNVEIQKIGYAFPGERSACYSADHLLRQYKRVRGEKGKNFHYQDIKNVYTIVFFERSPKNFSRFPNHYIHRFHQCSDTGLEMNLLQEYIFVSLDIFRKNMDNKTVTNEMDAWLSFLAYDEPERIEELITQYPAFRAMYQDIYDLCLNTERVMSMYSKELEILDRNTVRYMMDEMQAEMEEQKRQIAENEQRLADSQQRLAENQQQLAENRQRLADSQQQLADSQQLLVDSQQQLADSQQQLADSQQQLAENQQQLAENRQQLAEKDELIRKLQEELEALR